MSVEEPTNVGPAADSPPAPSTTGSGAERAFRLTSGSGQTRRAFLGRLWATPRCVHVKNYVTSHLSGVCK
jgi:hypothetical protein